MKRSVSLFALLILSLTVAAASARAQAPQRFFPKGDLMRIGVYYYPEQWPAEEWDRDFENMAAMGFEFTHFAEFAWAFLEPSDGMFDFAWLDRAVDLAAKHGLKVILCTPTPCPPAWLGEKYPEIYLVGADGRRREHGTRADGSLADDVFVRYSKRIVTELGRRYGKDARVWGWQLDNEPSAPPDYSPAARAKFPAWLRAKYGTIAALNEAWGGSFWSTRYDSFEQVLVPNEALFGEDALSPHALLDFRRFTADTQAAFLHMQADALRGLVRPAQWITTNYINVVDSADPRRDDGVDFASFTMYPVRGEPNLGEIGFRLGSPARLAFATDYYRSIKGVTGVMELQPGQVNWAPINPQPEPGAVRMWLWHAFAGGCSFACTYRYRQPRFGSELYHAGIVGPDGVTPSRGGLEFARVAIEVKKLRGLYEHLGPPLQAHGRGQVARRAGRLRRRGKRFLGVSLPHRAGLSTRQCITRREVAPLRRGRRPYRPDLPHGREGQKRPSPGGSVGRNDRAAHRGRGRDVRLSSRRREGARADGRDGV
jgi:beta-galactosidase